LHVGGGSASARDGLVTNLVHCDDGNSATVSSVKANMTPATEASRVGSLGFNAPSPFVGDDGASTTVLHYRFGRYVARAPDESGVGPEVAKDLIASVPRVPLLPVDSSFGETKNIDVVADHALADVLKVDKVVLGGDLVWIV
jgi:hypothetical protein